MGDPCIRLTRLYQTDKYILFLNVLDKLHRKYPFVEWGLCQRKEGMCLIVAFNRSSGGAENQNFLLINLLVGLTNTLIGIS